MTFIGNPAEPPLPAGLTTEQQAALAGIKEFLADSTRQTFSMHGPAGTGKSHLLGRLAKALPDALVATPTGKVAAVLRERFDVSARTIHSLFQRRKPSAPMAGAIWSSPHAAATVRCKASWC